MNPGTEGTSMEGRKQPRRRSTGIPLATSLACQASVQESLLEGNLPNADKRCCLKSSSSRSNDGNVGSLCSQTALDNGQTGKRLKVLKRQMYGRAKIDLLEARCAPTGYGMRPH
jgi:hypothetical protein